MAPELTTVLRSTLLRLFVFAFVPFWCSLTSEQFKSEFFEEVFDDVHHVWADVPNDVEKVQEGQCTRPVDAGRVLDMRIPETAVVVASLALRHALCVRTRLGWGAVVWYAEGVVRAIAMGGG